MEEIKEQKKKWQLPEIPHSWLIAGLLIGLIVLRAFGIDGFIGAGLGALIGYLLGVKLEQTRKG